MLKDGLVQVVRAAIMKEKDSLAHPPQGGGTEFLSGGIALRNSIRESSPHVVDSEIAERIEGDVVLCGEGGKPGLLRQHMTGLTPNVLEDLAPQG